MLGTKTNMSISRSQMTEIYLKENQMVLVSIGISPRNYDRTEWIRKKYKRLVVLATAVEKKKKGSKILFQIS